MRSAIAYSFLAENGSNEDNVIYNPAQRLRVIA
jgi:hypothetical protein